MFLTGLNTAIFLIGAAIVSFQLPPHKYKILIRDVVRIGIVCLGNGYPF